MTLRILLAVFTLLALNACTGNTVFNYTPKDTDPPLSAISTTQQALAAADALALEYDQWAKNVADSAQLFEVPLIGTAIWGVSEIAYSHPHPGPAITAALTGATIALLDTYYNPRARSSVYFSAGAASRCIARVAALLVQPTKTSSGGIPLDVPLMFDGMTIAQVAASADIDDSTRVTLQKLATLDKNKAQILADALDQVNSKAIASGLNASSAPNVTDITATLKNAVQSAQDLKSQGIAANKMAAARVAAVRAMGRPTPQALAAANIATTVTKIMDDPTVAALLTVESDATTCVAKAGT